MKKLLGITLGLGLSGLVIHAADGQPTPAPTAPKPIDPGGRAAIFKKYDKNGDGKLDEEERAALRKDREAEMIKKYDKNGDGKLDESERQAMREQMKKQSEEGIARRRALQPKGEEKKDEKK